jgi:hypothetical protein
MDLSYNSEYALIVTYIIRWVEASCFSPYSEKGVEIEMRRTVMIRRLTVLAIMVLAMMAFASPAWAETFTVDRLDDPVPVTGAGACSVLSNDCSLRGALEKSWTNGQTDTIGFALPGAGPHAITLSDALTTGTTPPTN